MTERLDKLELIDAEGDTLHVQDRGAAVYMSGWLLPPDEARQLARYLTTVADRQDPRPVNPTRTAADNVVQLPPADGPTILEEAQAAVYGDRQDDYGHPREDFTRTAIIWTGLLQHKLADGEYIEAEDVPRCMIGVKLARDVNAPKRDNRVDGAGYFLTLDRLETGR